MGRAEEKSAFSKRKYLRLNRVNMLYCMYVKMTEIRKKMRNELIFRVLATLESTSDQIWSNRFIVRGLIQSFYEEIFVFFYIVNFKQYAFFRKFFKHTVTVLQYAAYFLRNYYPCNFENTSKQTFKTQGWINF